MAYTSSSSWMLDGLGWDVCASQGIHVPKMCQLRGLSTFGGKTHVKASTTLTTGGWRWFGLLEIWNPTSTSVESFWDDNQQAKAVGSIHGIPPLQWSSIAHPHCSINNTIDTINGMHWHTLHWSWHSRILIVDISTRQSFAAKQPKAVTFLRVSSTDPQALVVLEHQSADGSWCPPSSNDQLGSIG